MKTIVYGQKPLSPDAKALKAKLDADPKVRREREIFARIHEGNATDADKKAYAEILRPLREGRQDIVRG